MSNEDRRRFTRAVLESTPRRAVTGHQGYEPTNPPPPPEAAPPPPPWPSPRAPPQPPLSPPPLVTLEGHVVRHSKWMGAVKTIASGLLMGGGYLLSATDWLRSRTSPEDVKKLAREVCVAEIASATAPISSVASRVRAVERRENKDDQRWDALDRWHSKQKRPSGGIAPQQFGPYAEKHGATQRYDEPEDPE